MRETRGDTIPPGRLSYTRLLQIREARTEVDVKDLSVQDQCGDRFDAEFFCFGEAAFVCTEMYDLDVKAVCVERTEQGLLGTDAHGTSGVVKDGFAFHLVAPFVLSGLPWSSTTCLLGYTGYGFRSRRYFLVR